MSQLFEELHKHKLFVNAKKSEFFLQDFCLGHIVSLNQVRMDQTKIEAIVERPKLASLHDVLSILGIFSYHQKLYSHSWATSCLNQEESIL